MCWGLLGVGRSDVRGGNCTYIPAYVKGGAPLPMYVHMYQPNIDRISVIGGASLCTYIWTSACRCHLTLLVCQVHCNVVTQPGLCTPI